MGGVHEVARRGELDSNGIGEVIIKLGRERATGLLELYSTGHVHKLAYRRGAPIHADLSGSTWRLGAVLSHLGIPIPQLNPELRHSGRGERKRLGTVLVEEGFLSPLHLEQALREQLFLRARVLLQLPRARYRFFEGAEMLDGLPRQRTRWTASGLVSAAKRSRLTRRETKDELSELVARLEGGRTPREALGLQPDASAREIRDAFRALALAHHPDRLGQVSDSRKRRLHRRAYAAAARAYEATRTR